MFRATVRSLALVVLAAAVSYAGEKVTTTIKDKAGKPRSFDMVLIPGGTFTMGTPKGEDDREDCEGPQHEVKVKPFYMATTETTFEMFMAYYEETVQEKRDDKKKGKKPTPVKAAVKKNVDAISGPTPLYGDPTMGWGGGSQPVIGLSWINAVTYCKWLSQKTGKKFRLPTEAEWEYACRAGTKTAYWFGDDGDDMEDSDWYEDNADEQTHKTAQKKANPFGLYDMHGNVREWCSDFYSPTAYAANAKTTPADSPKGPAETKTKMHVARGGAYDSPVEECRSGFRCFQEEWWRSEDPQEPKSVWWLPKMAFIGLRVVCEVE